MNRLIEFFKTETGARVAMVSCYVGLLCWGYVIWVATRIWVLTR